jgi:hypothetical protein
MFRSIKTAPIVRAALLVAGVLAVTSSFGLHPEPEHNGPAAAGVEWSRAGGALEENPHICFACLAHRSIPLPHLFTSVPAPRAAADPAPPASTSPLARLESHPREGRAPPSLV